VWAQLAADEDAAHPSGRKLQAADSIPDFNDVAAWQAKYFTVSWKEECRGAGGGGTIHRVCPLHYTGCRCSASTFLLTLQSQEFPLTWIMCSSIAAGAGPSVGGVGQEEGRPLEEERRGGQGRAAEARAAGAWAVW
jgi:hypothetical protein